eukprot:gene27842-36682_t
MIISFLLFVYVCSRLIETKPAYGNFTHRSTENNEGGNHLKNRSLRNQKANIFRHSPSILGSWSPFKVNESCPIFVVENDHGNDGFGDQFERYAHLLNIARLLQATAVPAFTNISGHSGSHEYIKLAQLMNINMNLLEEHTKYHISHHLSFSLDEVEKIHAEIMSNNGSSPRVPCNSIVRANMYDCSGTWCAFVLKEIHEVKWILKNNSFVSYCAKNKLGFQRERGKVNLLWHIRNGNLCIRCKDTQYFDSLLHMIHEALLHFESASNLDEVRVHYGSKASSYFVGRPIIESVCRMLTADILITSGSSMAYVVAISKGQLPLVMEEMRKEVLPQFRNIWGSVGSTIRDNLRHVFNEDEAVLLINGRPIVPEWKFNHRLVVTLSDLLLEESR